MKINNTKKLYEAFRQEFRKLSCGGVLCAILRHTMKTGLFLFRVVKDQREF